MNTYKKSKVGSLALTIEMAVFLILTQIIALMLAAPFKKAGIIAFQNPESLANPFFFFILIIAFTALIFIILKFGGKRLVYLVMIIAVAITIYYVMIVLIPFDYIPVIITVVLTFLLYKYPEWYVIDTIGLIIGGGAAAIFGISLGIVPVLLLLIILAGYDAIAVYKTKHMVSLAESIVDLRIPVLFVLPREREFSLLEEKKKNGEKEKKKDKDREGFFMGLGDAIIPSMLVVSANCVSTFPSAWMGINMPALGAMIGTLVGYAMLSRFVGKGKAQAGLPFLNSFAILGFLIGYIYCMI